MKNHLVLPLALVLAVLLTASSTGEKGVLENILLKNSKNQGKKIPDFGSKVVVIIYTDFEARLFSRPLAELSKKYRGHPHFTGAGIINLKDNPLFLPDWLVKYLIRNNEKNYATKLLFDEDHALKNTWGLGDCNDRAVIMIIGKDRKLKYMKKLISERQCRGILKEVAAVITSEIAGTR